MEDFEVLREAAGGLARCAHEDLMPGEVFPDAVGSVLRRATDAIHDVLLLAELRRLGLQLTGIDPFGTVVTDAGPVIGFYYRGRSCGIEATKDGAWEAFVDTDIDTDPAAAEELTVPVDRAGKPFDEVLSAVFAALDVLVVRAAEAEERAGL